MPQSTPCQWHDLLANGQCSMNQGWAGFDWGLRVYGWLVIPVGLALGLAALALNLMV